MGEELADICWPCPHPCRDSLERDLAVAVLSCMI